ncbi:hypothetical protein ACLMJK_008203, partial [Lecanora helva]
MPERRDRARNFGFPSSDPCLDERRDLGSSSKPCQTTVESSQVPRAESTRGKVAQPQEPFAKDDSPSALFYDTVAIDFADPSNSRRNSNAAHTRREKHMGVHKDPKPSSSKMNSAQRKRAVPSMVKELRPHNKDPSDMEEGSSSPRTTRKKPSSRHEDRRLSSISDQPTTIASKTSQNQSTQRRMTIPSMVKELLPHNEGPNISIEDPLGINFADPPNLRSRNKPTRMTREQLSHRRYMSKKAKPPPRRSLNLRELMRSQLEERDEMNTLSERASPRVPTRSLGEVEASISRQQAPLPTPARSPEEHAYTGVRYSVNDVARPLSEQVLDIDSSYAWMQWESRKRRITKCLTSHNRSLHRRTSLRLKGNGTVPLANQEVECSLEKSGTFVLKPTASQLDRFSDLIEMMESIAGQVKGVMKIIMPQERLNPYQNEDGDVLQSQTMLDTHAVKLLQNEQETKAGIYGMNSTLAGVGADALYRLQIYKKETQLRKKWQLNTPDKTDVWKESLDLEAFNENKMLDYAQRDVTLDPLLCAFDHEATPSLRHNLECADPSLSSFTGNALTSSKTLLSTPKFPGISHPLFHLSSCSGTFFPLQITKYATYTLNYHHAGAARCYTIVQPTHHQRLEQMLSLALNPDDPKAPKCSQSVSHAQAYIPKDTLRKHGIAFTEVTQFAGELLVTFPFAYFQGFNAGPNITEELLYATERWKHYHRHGLYVPCNKKCDGGPEAFDLGFARQPVDNDDFSDDEDADVLPSREKNRRWRGPFYDSSEDEVEESSEDDDEILTFKARYKRRRSAVSLPEPLNEAQKTGARAGKR